SEYRGVCGLPAALGAVLRRRSAERLLCSISLDLLLLLLLLLFLLLLLNTSGYNELLGGSLACRCAPSIQFSSSLEYERHQGFVVSVNSWSAKGSLSNERRSISFFMMTFDQRDTVWERPMLYCM
ncbi:unnamed protein product, partial [Polarella glacialis]